MIIFIHGLGRTRRCWNRAKEYFHDEETMAIGYPSMRFDMDKLADKYIAPVLDVQEYPVNILTHSMGSIVLRHYLKHKALPKGSRVVMLAPPNHGSEVVDFMKRMHIDCFLGPAARTMTTDMELRPIRENTGVIAATWSNMFTGSTFFDKMNDGKVSVDSTMLNGMADHITMPCSHTFIMKNDDVLYQAWHFFKYGRFER